jgi:hypothetical protein
MNNKLKYLFGFLNYTKIDELQIIYDYDYSYHDDTTYQVKKNGRWMRPSSISDFLPSNSQKTLKSLIDSKFSVIHSFLNLDIDEYWRLVLNIQPKENKISFDVIYKDLKYKKFNKSYRKQDFEPRLIKDVENIMISFETELLSIIFQGSWGETNVYEIYDDGYKVQNEYLRQYENELQHVTYNLMSFAYGKYWDDSWGGQGEIEISEDYIDIEFEQRDEIWKELKNVIVYEYKNIDNQSINENIEIDEFDDKTFNKIESLLKRKFPFILGIQKDGYRKNVYTNKDTLYVKVIVDLEKVKNYYKTDFHETYYNNPYLFKTFEDTERTFLFTPFLMNDKDRLVNFNYNFDKYTNLLISKIPNLGGKKLPEISIKTIVYKFDWRKYYNPKEYFFNLHGFYPTDSFWT